MKTILLSLLTISALSADVVQSTEIQLEGWQTGTYGTFQNAGSVIDLKERGLEKEISPSLVLDLKGTNQYVNFKLGYTKIANEGKKVLASDMQHNGVNFDRGELQKSTLDLDIIDAIYYISKPEDDLVDLEVGAGLRYVNGSFQTKVCSKETTSSFDKYFPIGYVRIEVTPPWTESLKWVNQLIMSPTDDIHMDIRTALKTDIYNDIGLEVGYRHNQFNTNDGYDSDIVSQGMYGALSYKF